MRVAGQILCQSWCGDISSSRSWRKAVDCCPRSRCNFFWNSSSDMRNLGFPMSRVRKVPRSSFRMTSPTVTLGCRLTSSRQRMADEEIPRHPHLLPPRLQPKDRGTREYILLLPDSRLFCLFHFFNQLLTRNRAFRNFQSMSRNLSP